MERTGQIGLAPSSIAGLLDIDCPLLRVRAVGSAIERLGFDWLEVVEIEPGRRARRVSGWDTLAPPDPAGAGTPAAACAGHDDLALALALASPLPCAWDLDSIEAVARRRSESQATACGPWSDWLARLRRVGVGSGLTFATRAENGGAWVVSLLAGRAGRHWMSDAVIGCALLVACVIAESSAAQGDSTDAALQHAEEALTPTQRHILECLSQGLPDKVIADRLGLSTHNVDYHLRRLRQRFGARNRVQLARAASGSRRT